MRSISLYLLRPHKYYLYSQKYSTFFSRHAILLETKVVLLIVERGPLWRFLAALAIEAIFDLSNQKFAEVKRELLKHASPRDLATKLTRVIIVLEQNGTIMIHRYRQ